MTQPRDVAIITTEPSRRRASRALWFAGHPLRNRSLPDDVRWLSYHFEAPGEVEPGQGFPCLHWPVIRRLPEASSLVLRGLLVDQTELRTSACVTLKHGGDVQDLGRVEDLIWDGVRQPAPLANLGGQLVFEVLVALATLGVGTACEDEVGGLDEYASERTRSCRRFALAACVRLDWNGGVDVAKKSKRVFRSRRYWARVVQEWRDSGQSQREFAEARGLAQTSLSRWARRLREVDDGQHVPAVMPPTFVEVRAACEGVAPGLPRLRLMVGGAVAEFGELPPPEYLAAVGLFAEGARC